MLPGAVAKNYLLKQRIIARYESIFLKRSKKANVRQTIREARKAARPMVAPGEVEPDFAGPGGSNYYLLNPISISGYRYSF